MALFPLLLGATVLTILLLLGWLAMTIVSGSRPAREIAVSRDEADHVARVRRRGLVVDLVAVGAGIAVAVAVLSGVLDGLPGLDLGRGTLLALGAGAFVGVLIICVGELTTPSPEGRVRHAGLARRSPSSFVGRGPAVVAGLGLATLAAVLTTGVLLASPDDMGREGRSINIVCPLPDRAVVGSGHGPFPGSFYAVPIALGGVGLVLLTAVSLSAVARRPGLGVGSAPLDAALRRGSATRILGALGVAAWGTTVPIAAALAMGLWAMRRPITYGIDGVERSVACAPGAYGPLMWAAVAVAAVALVLALWSLAEVVTGGRRELSDLTVTERTTAEVRW